MKKKKKNIPELRFPEFSGEWERRKLGELLDSIVDNRGKTPPIHSVGIPLLEVNSLGSLKIDYSRVSKFVTEDTFKNWFRNHLEKGDVLFSTVGNTALCSLYNGEKKAGIAQNIVGLRFKNDLGVFMYYLLVEENNNNKFKKIEMGAVQPSVKVSQMVELFFDIPTLPEQQRIANFLTSIDERLQTLKKKKSFLEQFKKGVIQKIFSQEIRFKDEMGKNFPKWQSKKLGEVGKFYAGGDLSKLKYSKMKDEKYVYPIYANGAGEGIYGYATTYQFNASCVTVSGRGNLGYAKVRTQKFNAIVRLIVIEPNKEVNPKFLEELVNETNFAVESTGVPQLTVPQISSYVVSFPCLEEQKKIANFLSSIDDKIDRCKKEIEKTELYKKGLLQKMFV